MHTCSLGLIDAIADFDTLQFTLNQHFGTFLHRFFNGWNNILQGFAVGHAKTGTTTIGLDETGQPHSVNQLPGINLLTLTNQYILCHLHTKPFQELVQGELVESHRFHQHTTR